MQHWVRFLIVAGLYPSAFLLFCTLNTPCRVTWPDPCISHYLKSLILRFLVLKSIRKIPVYMVNCTNVRYWTIRKQLLTNALGLDHVLTGLSIGEHNIGQFVICKMCHFEYYLLPQINTNHRQRQLKDGIILSLFSVTVKKKKTMESVRNVTTFYFSLLNSLFYLRSIFSKWNEKFILINTEMLNSSRN
jgi:hypothetical protein